MDAGFIENSATAVGNSPNDGPDDVEDVSDTNVDSFGNVIPDNETVESTNGDGTIDGDPANDPTVTTLIQNPELQVTKSITTPGAVVGDVIEYEITVLNSGNTTVSNIEITDVNADAGSIVGSPIASLAPGESAIVTAQQTITQADLDAGFIENSATATGDSPLNGPDDVSDVSDTNVDADGNAIVDNENQESANGDGTTDGDATNDPTVTSLEQNPSISVLKTALDLTDDNGDGVVGGIGDEINYVFVVENTGDVTLSNITISDPLPGIILSGGPIASLAVGEVDSNTFTATYVITQADIDAGAITNQATVTAEGPLGDLGDPSDDVTDDSDDPNNTTDFDNNGDGEPDDPTITSVTVFFDLAITKTVNETEPVVGDNVVFTIEISNIGNVTATNIVVDEVIPSGYTFVSALATAGTYSDFDGEWTINQLNPDQVELLELTVEVLGDGDYLNTATVVSANGGTDVDTSNDSDSATLEPICLTFYNEFSPNGDGVNDTFLIDCIERYPNNTLKIYNRWGNIVFEENGYLNDWNGISNGRAVQNQNAQLPVGTYYYVLDLGDGSEPRVGWVYINR
ncbi:MAG: gliding motility-associated C-terminal domain-containing protein, partial [Bacteroidia bacterium]|nr:gliding motility-associated C-terminal domain-containing protein [Bacteroidia bacterium]